MVMKATILWENPLCVGYPLNALNSLGIYNPPKTAYMPCIQQRYGIPCRNWARSWATIGTKLNALTSWIKAVFWSMSSSVVNMLQAWHSHYVSMIATRLSLSLHVWTVSRPGYRCFKFKLRESYYRSPDRVVPEVPDGNFHRKGWPVAGEARWSASRTLEWYLQTTIKHRPTVFSSRTFSLRSWFISMDVYSIAVVKFNNLESGRGIPLALHDPASYKWGIDIRKILGFMWARPTSRTRLSLSAVSFTVVSAFNFKSNQTIMIVVASKRRAIRTPECPALLSRTRVSFSAWSWRI